jgi:hypothetical protein
MGVDCISGGYKDLLSSLITRDMAKNILIEVLTSMPLCEPMPAMLSPQGQQEVETLRKKATPWDLKVDYTNEKGGTEAYTSPSALVRSLGLKMSGQQTTCDGVKCTAMSVVDILRLGGYVVACEDEKGLTLDCLKASAGGKAMHVMHPAVLTMKKAAASKLPEEVRKALEVGRTWAPAK